MNGMLACGCRFVEKWMKNLLGRIASVELFGEEPGATSSQRQCRTNGLKKCLSLKYSTAQKADKSKGTRDKTWPQRYKPQLHAKPLHWTILLVLSPLVVISTDPSKVWTLWVDWGREEIDEMEDSMKETWEAPEAVPHFQTPLRSFRLASFWLIFE